VAGYGSNSLAANRSASGSRVTVISASVNAVVTETEYGAVTDYSPAQYATAGTAAVAYDASDATNFPNSSSVTTRVYPSYGPSSRGTAFGGASAYARIQESSERQPLIDTYA